MVSIIQMTAIKFDVNLAKWPSVGHFAKERGDNLAHSSSIWERTVLSQDLTSYPCKLPVRIWGEGYKDFTATCYIGNEIDDQNPSDLSYNFVWNESKTWYRI